MGILGILAAIVYLAAFTRYVYAMLKAGNRPNRATWLIWALLGFVLLGSYYASGAKDTLPLLLVNQIGMISVFLLSLKYGQGGVDKFDIACLAGAAVSLLSWAITNNPVYALMLGITTDFIGALPTIKKAMTKEPNEDKITWFLFLIGNGINFLGSDMSSFSNYIYPLYMTLLCLLIFCLLVKNKHAEK